MLLHLPFFRSDDFPRRSCCFFTNFKIKNLNILTKRYFNKKRGRNYMRSVFCISIFFNFKNNFKPSGYNCLCPFFPKTKKNQVSIISQKFIFLKKQNTIVTHGKNFSNLIYRKISNDCKFLFLEKKCKFFGTFFIPNLFKKNKISIYYFNIKEKTTQTLINSFIRIRDKFTKRFIANTIVKKIYCYKKLFNNILQTIGNTFDFISKSYKSVKKIGIKKKSFFFYI